MNRNIVLLCLDTVRKDYFDNYALSLRSRASYSLEECRAASSWTVPSHASMFTGELPHEHGAHTYNRSFNGISKSETFLSNLDRYQTFGVSANHFAGSAVAFDTLFDRFVDIDPRHMYQEFGSSRTRNLLNRLTEKIYYVTDGRPIPKLRDDGAQSILTVAERLISAASSPFFLFANFIDAHQPHARHIHHRNVDVPYQWSSNIDFVEKKWDININGTEGYDTFLRNYRSLYAASIDYLDRVIDKFIERVTTLTNRPTTVIITSDHGEHLGFEYEDGLFEHTSSLSESLVHVPLEIINPPTDFHVPDGSVSQLDLGGLMQALTEGSEWSPQTTPRSEIIGASPGVSDTLTDQDFQWWTRGQRCRIERDRKIIWDTEGNCREYELPDTACREQLVGRCGEGAPEDDAFGIDLSEYKRQFTTERETDSDDQVLDRLKDLGYA